MVWEARKRLPFRFGRWHGRLLDCPPPPLFGNRHRRARDVAIHATFCARTVADPTSEQAPPVRYETIALPRRNIRRATPISMSSRGICRESSRKFHADRSPGSSLVSPLGLNIALKCWGMAADGD